MSLLIFIVAFVILYILAMKIYYWIGRVLYTFIYGLGKEEYNKAFIVHEMNKMNRKQ